MRKFNCVLLIDDDETVNFINYRIIDQMNITDKIELAMNGEKALNMVQYFAETHDNNSPELILLDLKMPELNGREFLEYFYRKNLDNKHEVKIVLISNSVDPKELVAFNAYPNASFIKKPLTKAKLEEVLASTVK